jgi:hypothetical protein
VSAVGCVMCQNRLVRQTLRAGLPEAERLMWSGNSVQRRRFLRGDEIQQTAELALN